MESLPPHVRRLEPSFPYLNAMIAVLRQSRVVVGSAAVAGALVALLSLLSQPTYTAVSEFFPRSRRAAASVSGLAAQLGLSLPTNEVTEGPAFFEQLVRTREVMDSALVATYTFTVDSGLVRSTLLDLYPIGGDSMQRLLRARKRLLKNVSTYTNPKSGIIELEVRANHPVLAAEVNARLLELLDRYNRVARQSQASAEREFTERRLAEVRSELRSAEDGLEEFLTRNREYRSSAQLTFEQERLAREVALRQQIATTLAQAYEQARIEEVRDTPVLTVVEAPRPPEQRDGRGTIWKSVLGAILGGLLAIAVIVVSLNLELVRAREPGRYEEFVAARRRALADLPRPWRAFRPRG